MKHMLKKIIWSVTLLSVCGFSTITLPHIFIRSQSVDSTRELVGWTHKINLCQDKGVYGTFAITPEYTQSFQAYKIAQTLFGGNLSNFCDHDLDNATIEIAGSRIANRSNRALLADYFGLPTDFQSSISLKPRVETFLIDFNMYLGLDCLLEGLWLRAHAPFVYTSWNLRMREDINHAGAFDYSAGYFSRTPVARDQLLNGFLSYLNGDSPYLNGDVEFIGLEHGRVPLSCNEQASCFDHQTKSLHKTGFSELQVALGWNFWLTEDYHFGLGARASVPTGTNVNDTYLFQPMIGNGHHWEVGAMMTSHYTFWRNCDMTKSFGLYVDINLTTLLDTQQCRTFDLCNRGKNSKYMLASRVNQHSIKNAGGGVIRDSADYNLQGNVVAATAPLFTPPVAPPAYVYPSAGFNNEYTPVANIASAVVNVNIPFQADLTALFNYTSCGWEVDFGYNYWGTDCESIEFCSKESVIPENTWALKGDSYMFGFDATSDQPVPLSSTQDSATLYSGKNFVNGTTLIQGQTNPGVDNAYFAYGDGSGPNGTARHTLFSQNDGSDHPTRTSVNPIYLSDCDLDVAGARKKGTSQAVFAHVSYTWDETHCIEPYFGAGMKVEFTTQSNDSLGSCGSTSCAEQCMNDTGCSNGCLSSDCGSSCFNSAFSQWSLWVKGGLSF